MLVLLLHVAAALAPPQLLGGVGGGAPLVFVTAPPRAVDPDGALARRVALAANASAFVVDATASEPAPLHLPTVEVFAASDDDADADADGADARASEADATREALEAAAGNAWRKSDARARRVARDADQVLARATAPEASEPSVDWALGRSRRLLTARRGGFVDVLCAVEDEESFADLAEIFAAGVKGEAARRADAEEPRARFVSVSAAAVPESVAARERCYDDVFFRRAVRDDARAVYGRALDDDAVYWVAGGGDAAPTLPRGAPFVAEAAGPGDYRPGCVAIVVDWRRVVLPPDG